MYPLFKFISLVLVSTFLYSGNAWSLNKDQLMSSFFSVVMIRGYNDAGGLAIIACLEAIKKRNPPNIQVHRSLGRHLYHGVLALAKDSASRIACVGNSSSGIKETPAFGCPSVNIGSRQAGRLRGSNVLDVGYDGASILETVRRCLFDDDFKTACLQVENPYYLGGAGKKIAEILARVPLDQKLIRKRMTLRGETKDGWYR